MEFLEVFDMNKRYIFDKDIYIEYMQTIDEYTGKDVFEEHWLNTCNNKEIELIDITKGSIASNNAVYTIMPMWCREVPSKIRLMD